MAINLTKEDEERVIASIREFFDTELDQEIGDLKARLVLDYVLAEIAPFAYNRGVADAEGYFRARVEDLPGTCYQPPLGYWTRKSR